MRPFLTVRMVAETLHRHENTIRCWIEDGTVPAYKVGHGLYVREWFEGQVLQSNILGAIGRQLPVLSVRHSTLNIHHLTFQHSGSPMLHE